MVNRNQRCNRKGGRKIHGQEVEPSPKDPKIGVCVYCGGYVGRIEKPKPAKKGRAKR